MSKSESTPNAELRMNEETAATERFRIPGPYRQSALGIVSTFGLCLLGIYLNLGAITVSGAEKVTFDDHVMPILRNHCLNCHNPDKKKADLDLSNFNGALAGSSSGEVITPGSLDDSFLWSVVSHIEEPFMPPKKPKLPENELAVIRQWIEGGLLENSGSKARAGNKPKISLALDPTKTGKPDGPPPMPDGDLLLEPVIRAERAGAVTALTASPWAPLAAVAGQKQVLLYNIDTLALEGVLPFPEGFPYVLSFSRSGRLLIAGGGVGAKVGKVVVYDVASGNRVAEVGDEFDAVMAADISPDQTKIALGGSSKVIRIYSIATGELLHSIKKHTEWITSISYSPDGVLLATADRNGGVHLWEAESANAYSELKAGTPSHVTQIAWRDDSNVIATSHEDGNVKLWSTENSTQIKAFKAHNSIQSVAFAHDGRIVTTGRDRRTKLWSGDGKEQQKFDGLRDIALATAISHDMKRVLSGDFAGNIIVWDTEDGKKVGSLDANPPTLDERIQFASSALKKAQAEHKVLEAKREKSVAQVTSATEALEKIRIDSLAAEQVVKSAKKHLANARLANRQATRHRGLAEELMQFRTMARDVAQAKLKSTENEWLLASNATGPASMAVESASNELEHSRKQNEQAQANAAAKPDDQLLAKLAVEANLAVETARVALAEAEASLATAQSNSEAAKKQFDRARVDATKAQAELDHATSDLQSTETSLTEVKRDLQLAEQQLPQAQKAAEAAKAKISPAEKRLETTKGSLLQAENELTEAKQRVTESEWQLARWQAAKINVNVIAASNELDQLEIELANAVAIAEEHAEDAAGAGAQVASIRRQLEAHPELLKSRQNEVAAAKTSLDSLKSELPKLKANAGSRREELNQTKQQLDEATKTLTHKRSMLAKAEAAVINSQASYQLATETAEKARQTAKELAGIADLVEAAAKAEIAATTAKSALTSTERGRKAIESDVLAMEKSHGETKAAFDAASEALAHAEELLNTHPVRLMEAESKLTAATQALKDAEMLPEKLNEELLQAQGALSSSKTAAKDAAASIEAIRAKLEPIQVKHQKLRADYLAKKPQS